MLYAGYSVKVDTSVEDKSNFPIDLEIFQTMIRGPAHIVHYGYLTHLRKGKQS